MDTTIGERIELILKYYKLTKKQFAESISYSPGNITDWVKGRYKPSSRALINIENTYNISESWLINGIGDMLISNTDNTDLFVTEISKQVSSLGTLTKEEINIINLYRKLTDRDKIKIEGIMEMKAAEAESSSTYAELSTCQTGEKNKNII